MATENSDGEKPHLTIVSGGLPQDPVSLRVRARYEERFRHRINISNAQVAGVDDVVSHDAQVKGNILGVQDLESKMSVFPRHRVRGGLESFDDDPDQSA